MWAGRTQDRQAGVRLPAADGELASGLLVVVLLQAYQTLSMSECLTCTMSGCGEPGISSSTARLVSPFIGTSQSPSGSSTPLPASDSVEAAAAAAALAAARRRRLPEPATAMQVYSRRDRGQHFGSATARCCRVPRWAEASSGGWPQKQGSAWEALRVTTQHMQHAIKVPCRLSCWCWDVPESCLGQHQNPTLTPWPTKPHL